jgi:hypothetical protein
MISGTKEGYHRQKRAKKMLSEIAALISHMAASEEDRDSLADRIIDEIKQKYPKEISPTRETVLQRISRARNQEILPADQPWHMGSLDEPNYRLPSEAIPYILKVQDESRKFGWEITIRQAKWISRLCGIKTIQQTDSLSRVSRAYAMYERSWEIAKLPSPCNTSTFDKSLIDGTWKIVIREWEGTQVQTNFKSFKRAFEETTKIEMAGVMVPVTSFYVSEGRVFAFNDKDKDIFIPLPANTKQEELLSFFRKQKMLRKVIKNPPDGISLLFTLRKPYLIEVPADRLIPKQQQNGGIK